MAPATASENSATRINLQPGDHVDNYVIRGQVGAGGSSVVYKAQDPVVDRYVAIKQVMLGGGDTERMRDRVKAEARLQKKAGASEPRLLVQHIDTVDDRRGLLLISEFVDGQSLEQRLSAEPNALPQREALGIIAGIAKALQAIHAAGILHRDLKPANVLLPHAGGLKVADFGLATLSAEQDGMTLGTVRYMAPELLRAESGSPSSDLYSLGMIAFECLVGRAKFDEAFRSVLRDQRNQAMRWIKWHTNQRASATPIRQLNPDVDPQLVDLVERLMEKDPGRRFSTAEQVIDAVGRIVASGLGDGSNEPTVDQVVVPAPTMLPGHTAPLPRKSKLPLILGSLLVFWLMVITGFFIWQQTRDQAAADQELQAIQAMYDDARDLYNDGDLSDAQDLYNQLAEQQQGTDRGDQAAAMVVRLDGEIAERDGDFAAALEHFEQYLDMPGADPDRAQQAMARLRPVVGFNRFAREVQELIDGGDLRRAEQQLRVWLNTMRPTEPEREVLTRLQDEIDYERDRLRLTDAARAARAAAQRDPSEGIAQLQETLGSMRQSRFDFPEMRVELEQLLGELQGSQQFQELRRVAQQAQDEGRTQDAIDGWRAVMAEQEALGLQPDSTIPQTISELRARQLRESGYASIDAGRTEEGVSLLRQSLELADDAGARQRLQAIATDADRQTIVARANAAVNEQQYEQAIELYERALQIREDPELDRRIEQATFALGMQQAEQAIEAGELTEAREHLTRIQPQDPANQDIARQLQYIDERLAFERELTAAEQALAEGDFADAVRTYQRAIDLLGAALVFDTPAAPIRLLQRQAERQNWISQGDRAFENGQYDLAETLYLTAMSMGASPDLDQKLQITRNRIAEESR
jgi:serine/threonine-protein kinase